MSSEAPDSLLVDIGKEGPFVRNFIEYYPWACKRFFPDYIVTIKKNCRADTSSLKTKSHTSNFLVKQRSEDVATSFQSVHYMNYSKPKTTFITAVMDSPDGLLEIVFNPGDICPKMIKLISVIIEYHPKLNSLTFKCKINQQIIHEVSKLLPVSNITLLCLDGTFVPQGNYYSLLSEPSALKSLSLARCSINDEVIEKLVSHLCFPKRTCESLTALNLSSNYITDKGAKYISEMLRGNRHLSYLNLSGNTITDTGLNYILETLMMFPLTFQERNEQFIQLNAFIDYQTKMMQQLAEKFVNDQSDKKSMFKMKSHGGDRQDVKSVIRTINKRQPSMMSVKTVVQNPCVSEKDKDVERNIDEYNHPHGGDNVQKKHNIPYCLGNNSLSYLNLAYNNLTYLSLNKIQKVLQYQIQVNRKPRGLIRVVIEGNRLPEWCFEFDRLDYLFGSFLIQVGKPRKSLTPLKYGRKSITSNRSGKDGL